MPTIQEVMGKAKSSAKKKYFREGEASRAYQELGKKVKVSQIGRAHV